MKVRSKRSDDWTVLGPEGGFSKATGLIRPGLGSLIGRLQNSRNGNYHSGNWLPSSWSADCNAADIEVVNLHWVGDETLSIEDIGRIRRPIVWTMHDMWPFCGTEHYAPDDKEARWRHGYAKSNCDAYESGLDLDRLAWLRKQRSWNRPAHAITPSRWLADCACESSLFKNWRITVIPNVLDTRVFQPLDRDVCRQALGLPNDRLIVLFGAIGGWRDPRKGYDLLLEALNHLAANRNVEDVLCVVVGQKEPKAPPKMLFPIRWMGHVHNDATLALLYNSADVAVVPSRQENLPQTATEAQSCGCPVVAFNCTGLSDAVVHLETGYLAKAFDVSDMAQGLEWILIDAARQAELGRAARERALRLWAPEVVVPQYLSVYRSAIEQK